MNTSRYFNAVLSAVFVMGLGIGITSCKSDEGTDAPTVKESTLQLDEKIERFGIETDMQSAIVDVKVDCKGRWSAVVPSDCEWCEIDQNALIYDGPQTLSLNFTENRSGLDRQTTLTIMDDAKKRTDIKVVQTMLYNGEAPTNADGDYKSTAVGFSVNYDYFLNTAIEQQGEFSVNNCYRGDNVFNMARVRQLDTERILAAYHEEQLAVARFHEVMFDSITRKSDSISVTMNVEVSFGFINFNARGAYHAADSVSMTNVNYFIQRKAPAYRLFVSPDALGDRIRTQGQRETLRLRRENADFIKDIDNYEAELKAENGGELSEGDKAYVAEMRAEALKPAYDNLLSPGMRTLYYNITTALRQKNYTLADQYLNVLDAKYGPFFIGSAEYGGTLVMNCELKNSYVATNGGIGAELDANGEGLFSIGGKLKWSEDGLRSIHDSNMTLEVYGGDAAPTATALREQLKGDDPTNQTKLEDILKAWAESLKPKGEGRNTDAALLNISFTPIWTIFDASSTQYVEEFFRKKYSDRGIDKYINSMQGVTITSTKDLLGAVKDGNGNPAK